MRAVLLFTLFLSSIAIARPRLSAYVPSSSDLYADLDRLESYGCARPTFRALRPQSYFDLGDAVSPPSGLSSDEETAGAPCAAPPWLLQERAALGRPFQPPEISVDNFETDGDEIPLLGTESQVTGLYPLREGRPFFDGVNLYTELTFAGQGGKDLGLAFGVTPGWAISLRDYQYLNGLLYLQEGYIKVGYHHLELTLGRVGLQFGDAWHGSLLFSGAAAPLNLASLSLRPHHIEPLAFLGPVTLGLWAAGEGESQFINNATLAGVEGGLRPAPWLELAFLELVQFGGTGAPGTNLNDYLRMIIYSGASDLSAKRHRSMALFFGFWGPSQFVKLSTQFLFDSLSSPSNWFTAEVSTLVTLWFPRLGEWELHLEGAWIQPGAYQSSFWRQGFTLQDTPLGDPLGPDAEGLYFDLGLPALAGWRPRLTGIFESRLNHPASGQATETRYGGGLGVRKQWDRTELLLSGRYASVSNALYVPGQGEQLLSGNVTLRYSLF